jgi:hypothetical protein
MLSHWKTWITDCLGQHAPKRRLAAPRFRGQLESLESRNVLSATIGVVSFDVVAVRVEPTSVTVVAMAEFSTVTPHFEDYRQFVRFVDGPNGPGEPLAGQSPHGNLSSTYANMPWLNHPKLFYQLHSQSGTTNGLPDKGSGGAGRTDPFDETDSGGTDPSDGRIRATAPTVDDTSDALTGMVHASGGQQMRVSFTDVPPPPLRLGGAFLSSATYLAPTTENTGSLERNTLDTRDAAFDDLSTSSLLIATTADSDRDDHLFDDKGDKFDVLDESDEQEDDSAHEAHTGKLAESLDALQREQAAVDAVLTELHDVKLSDNATRETSPTIRHQSSDLDRDFAERFFFVDAKESEAASCDASAGGMVLLAARGDANSSAYDLAAPITTAVADHGLISLAVEAPVGLYQAVDVGVRPEPTITAQNASTAEPAAKAQTNVSAENAPAKKSEQPAA